MLRVEWGCLLLPLSALVRRMTFYKTFRDPLEHFPAAKSSRLTVWWNRLSVTKCKPKSVKAFRRQNLSPLWFFCLIFANRWIGDANCDGTLLSFNLYVVRRRGLTWFLSFWHYLTSFPQPSFPQPNQTEEWWPSRDPTVENVYKYISLLLEKAKFFRNRKNVHLRGTSWVICSDSEKFESFLRYIRNKSDYRKLVASDNFEGYQECRGNG